MAEFKIYRKQVAGMRGLNDKSLKEVEKDISDLLNTGWKVINSSTEGAFFIVSLVKD